MKNKKDELDELLEDFDVDEEHSEILDGNEEWEDEDEFSTDDDLDEDE